MPETQLISFVLRFTQECSADLQTPAAEWHGTLRHVQTNEELHFTQMSAALAFISRYVELNNFLAAPHPKS